MNKTNKLVLTDLKPEVIFQKMFDIQDVYIEKLERENKKIREALVIAEEALIFCAKRKHCREYSCCASCGPIYEAEEALEKIEALGMK